MKTILSHFRRFDWILVIAAVLITGIGFLAIYNSSSNGGDFSNLKKQISFFSLGLFLMIIFSFLDWRNFRNNPYLILVIYFICILSLVLLFLFAPEVRGTKSWYRIGTISVDPVEFTKIILIILLAKYFSMRHIEMYRMRHIFLSGAYVLLPTALIFFQPNLGSVLILLAIWLGVLIISGIKIRHFLILILIFASLLALSWGTILKDYQKMRIVGFFMPQLTDPLETGWNQAQSKIAIGAGGFLGQGIGNGSQTQYGFLPESHNDFVFANIAESTGLLGVMITLALFMILIWRIMKIAVSANNNFPRLFASGVIILLITQIFIHMGMNMGILPIIGISLPLISYGGSGLIAVFMAIGILQNIKINQ
ncbi:MAG: FtsW/RodA/SpoVE family cell cycle protein [Patescibacteria group bacterium]